MRKKTLPQPADYNTADEWLVALEEHGQRCGAKPIGPFGLGRLCARGPEAAFWDQIAGIGSSIPEIPMATIEEQLRAVYAIRNAK